MTTDAPRKDTVQDARPSSPSRIGKSPQITQFAMSANRLKETAEPVQPPEQLASDAENKPAPSLANGAASNAQPLGPPPRPSQQNPSDAPDYFNQSHSSSNGGAYQAEPNPFEAQFGNPSAETP